MLSYIGLSGVYICFFSPWLHGTKNPLFVAVHYRTFLMFSTSLVLSSSSDVKLSVLCKRAFATECSNGWFDSQFRYWSVLQTYTCD